MSQADNSQKDTVTQPKVDQKLYDLREKVRLSELMTHKYNTYLIGWKSGCSFNSQTSYCQRSSNGTYTRSACIRNNSASKKNSMKSTGAISQRL